jgi:hypothetical protein
MAQAFLTAIGTGSGAERMMGIVWRDARLLRVERRAPMTTESGKIQHLYSMFRGPAGRGSVRASPGPPDGSARGTRAAGGPGA